MNTNAYTLIGRAICQLLDNNTPIYKTTITEAMSEIFMPNIEASMMNTARHSMMR
ncbi:hypothetical protein [Xenorhabdus bovienii]|uniref:hypothetical protein n=1 Tax=Xenorhabdus bovienii TaxID=40576 RepID=UPI0023B31583|nr:hypothetical protein [Xenorhabdus bovienii]